MPSSSLGFHTATATQPTRPVTATSTTTLSHSTPETPARPPHSCRRYAVSCWSVLSVLSILSLLSFGGVCSVGSVLSVFSIGSTLSFLSIGSVQSSISVYSNTCHMGLFQDCTKSHRTDSSFTIKLSAEVWATMASCSKTEYKAEERPQKCEYQAARCSYSQSDWMDCQVRRKGSSTWRNLDAKPSLKVKFEDRIEFMTSSCSAQYCPPGKSTNVHKSKKVTLNNMVIYDGEVAAYREFRKHMPAPNAKHVSVALYRDETLMAEETYAMVENVNDKEFMKKHFGEDYLLYEVDSSKVSFERDGGRLTQLDMTVESLLAIPISKMKRDHVLKYYACERLVGHWDGTCTNPRGQFNHYVAYDGDTFSYVPWGLDQTYHPCKYAWLSDTSPQCVPVQECFRNASCVERFATVASNVNGQADQTIGSCTADVVLLLLLVLAHLVVCGAVAFAVRRYMTPTTTRRRLPRPTVPMITMLATHAAYESSPSRMTRGTFV